MTETVFAYAAPSLKSGRDASSELALDLQQLDVRRVLLVTDAGVAATGRPGQWPGRGRLRRRFFPLGVGIFAGRLVISLLVLADRVPLHFGADGSPDRWGPDKGLWTRPEKSVAR